MWLGRLAYYISSAGRNRPTTCPTHNLITEQVTTASDPVSGDTRLESQAIACQPDFLVISLNTYKQVQDQNFKFAATGTALFLPIYNL